MSLIAALDELTAILKQAGIRAHIDPQKVSAPGAWIAVESLFPARLDGSMIARAKVHLIRHNLPTRQVLPLLESDLAKALTVITPDGDIETDAHIATESGPLPCFIIPLDIHIERIA